MIQGLHGCWDPAELVWIGAGGLSWGNFKIFEASPNRSRCLLWCSSVAGSR